MECIDIGIIGGGPAGLTAALYGARARARTVVFEMGMPGGQVVKTELVENYPAFPEGITGPELGDLMLRQAEHFGAEVRTLVEVEAIRRRDQDFILEVDGEEVQAKSVILATGAVPKKLNVPGEELFTGRGVSYCATCDGALFRDRVVAVVGGGDSAVQEAQFLTKFAKRVHLIHRRGELRATECLQETCFMNPVIELHWNRIVKEIRGANRMEGALLVGPDVPKGEFLPCDGIFVFVGVDPTNELVKDMLDLDAQGFVPTDPNGLTTIPGLYAAGDVTVGDLRQVITAAAKGASAAFEAQRYLETVACNI